MIPILSLRQPVFLASWVNAFTKLPFRFPVLRPIIDSLLSSSTTSISETIVRSVPHKKKHISDYLKCTGKVQQRLYSVTASSNAQNLLENAPTARDVARLYSTTSKGAGAWLNAIPTSEVFALNSYKFCLGFFLRLGLPTVFSSWTTTCNCGALIDDSKYHFLTCQTGGGPVWFTNRFCPSGLIGFVCRISTTEGSRVVVIQLQTTNRTSYFLTRTLETTST